MGNCNCTSKKIKDTIDNIGDVADIAIDIAEEHGANVPTIVTDIISNVEDVADGIVDSILLTETQPIPATIN